MSPLIHLLASLIISFFLFPSYGLSSLFVLIGGFLIDIDHAMHYCFKFKFKKMSLSKILGYYLGLSKNKKIFEIKGDLFPFHNIELLVICIVLSFYSKIFLIITFGLLLHYLLDFLNDLFSFKGPVKAISIILYLKKHYNKNTRLPNEKFK